MSGPDRIGMNDPDRSGMSGPDRSGMNDPDRSRMNDPDSICMSGLDRSGMHLILDHTGITGAGLVGSRPMLCGHMPRWKSVTPRTATSCIVPDNARPH